MSLVYLQSPSTDPRFNLALEEYVFERFDRGHEYFMLWQNHNTVVVGKYQNTVEEINADYLREREVTVVRRLSGGGAVYHDLGNLNFTFIMDSGRGAKIDFSAFCLPVVEVLLELGVPAEMTGRNDLVIAGRKFSGNAQYLREGRVMHHGTLMFDSDLEAVAAALNVSGDKIASKGVKSVRSRVCNIREYLPAEISLQEFKQRLVTRIFAGRELIEHRLDEEELRCVEDLARRRYAGREWTYGKSPAYDIRKERRVEGCGKITVYLRVAEDRISAFGTRGDYFGHGDPEELAQALIGCPLQAEALRQALSGLEIDDYFRRLTAEQLIEIILQ